MTEIQYLLHIAQDQIVFLSTNICQGDPDILFIIEEY